MDPVRNPYAPGAGTRPPELAGREDLIEEASIAIRRTAQTRPVKSLIIVGLRGVGKTVLLNEFRSISESEGFHTISLEAHEGKSLPRLLAPAIRQSLIRISTREKARDIANRGLRILAGFLKAMKINISGMEVGFDPELGTADSGDLEADLPELFAILGAAAKAANWPVCLLIDEMQYLAKEEFSALIMSIHKVNQLGQPLILMGAGLPQILGIAGNSKSYAERLFSFPKVGALTNFHAERAIVNPARAENVEFNKDAVQEIIAKTEGYPYFIQQWSYEAWNYAEESPIKLSAVRHISEAAIHELDQSFFRVRLDRCTPLEKKYMRALAELGTGIHRSADVATLLDVKPASASPTRSSLIKKGMIYSPSHGDTEFTVPLFDQFMKREIPNLSDM